MAVDYCLKLGIQNIWQRIQSLAAYTRQQLATVPGVTVLDKGRVLCGIVSFVVDLLSCDEVQPALLSGSLCHSRNDDHTASGKPVNTVADGMASGTARGDVKSASDNSDRLKAGRAVPINVHVSRKGSTLVDYDARGLTETLRASVHYYNTEADVDMLVKALKVMTAAAGQLK